MTHRRGAASGRQHQRRFSRTSCGQCTKLRAENERLRKENDQLRKDSPKFGGGGLGLQRVLGLSCYRLAWTWLHRLHDAMVRPGCDRPVYR